MRTGAPRTAVLKRLERLRYHGVSRQTTSTNQRHQHPGHNDLVSIKAPDLIQQQVSGKPNRVSSSFQKNGLEHTCLLTSPARFHCAWLA